MEEGKTAKIKQRSLNILRITGFGRDSSIMESISYYNVKPRWCIYNTKKKKKSFHIGKVWFEKFLESFKASEDFEIFSVLCPDKNKTYHFQGEEEGEVGRKETISSINNKKYYSINSPNIIFKMFYYVCYFSSPLEKLYKFSKIFTDKSKSARCLNLVKRNP